MLPRMQLSRVIITSRAYEIFDPEQTNSMPQLQLALLSMSLWVGDTLLCYSASEMAFLVTGKAMVR